MINISRDKKIAVIGGDVRQLYCARSLSERGFECCIYGLENVCEKVGCCTKCRTAADCLSGSSIVILPLPLTTDSENVNMPFSDSNLSVEELFSNIERDSIVFAGKIPEDVKNKAFENGIKIFDYNEREEFAIANAYLTAESAVGIAMNSLNTSIKGMKTLVVGYGRIGKCLCHILKALGSDVYASARKKKDFEWIRAYGYSAVNTENVNEVFDGCKLIFNTVPHLLFDCEMLSKLDEDTFVVDLASRPGGVDFDCAKINGIKVVWALGLPGKKLYKSAGKVQADVVMSILEDEVDYL